MSIYKFLKDYGEYKEGVEVADEVLLSIDGVDIQSLLSEQIIVEVESIPSGQQGLPVTENQNQTGE